MYIPFLWTVTYSILRSRNQDWLVGGVTFFCKDMHNQRLNDVDNDWLIIYSFTSRSRIFHLYGDVTITGKGLQNLGLCSALRAFEHRGIFIVPHLLRHGALVFPVSSEEPPHSVASYDTHGDVEDLFLHRSWRSPSVASYDMQRDAEDLYSYPDPHGFSSIWVKLSFAKNFLCMLSIIPVKLIYLTHLTDLQHPYKDWKPLIFILTQEQWPFGLWWRHKTIRKFARYHLKGLVK
jgi:hypothetical protein